MQTTIPPLQPFPITFTVDHYRPKQAGYVLGVVSDTDMQILTALWSCQIMLAELTANLN